MIKSKIFLAFSSKLSTKSFLYLKTQLSYSTYFLFSSLALSMWLFTTKVKTLSIQITWRCDVKKLCPLRMKIHSERTQFFDIDLIENQSL